MPADVKATARHGALAGLVSDGAQRAAVHDAGAGEGGVPGITNQVEVQGDT